MTLVLVSQFLGLGTLTGYTADLTSGETAAASTTSGGNVAGSAIDDNTGTYWQSTANSGQWIQVTFAASKIIRKMTLRNTASGAGFNSLPGGADLQYYNGSSYVTVASIVPTGVDTLQEFTLDETSGSTIWRILQTADAIAGPGTNIAIDELEMMEGTYA